MAEKRMYWLQIGNAFIEERVIKKLRRQKNGDRLFFIALRILIKSLESNFHLYFEGVEPTFAEEIALDLDEDTEDVSRVIDSFMEQGWLVEEESGVYYSPKSEELCGSESASTIRSRRFRKNKEKKQLLHGDDKALHCNGTELHMSTEKIECNADKTDTVTPNIQRNAYATACNENATLDKDKEIDKDSIHPIVLPSSENADNTDGDSDGRMDDFVSFSPDVTISRYSYEGFCNAYGKNHVDDKAKQLADGISSGRMSKSANTEKRLAGMLHNAEFRGEFAKHEDPTEKRLTDNTPLNCPHCGRKLDSSNSCLHCRLMMVDSGGGNWTEEKLPDEEELKKRSEAIESLLRKGGRLKFGRDVGPPFT